ncbi:hypothetical protein THAOC_30325, partial [Thalassiosira oceanica]
LDSAANLLTKEKEGPRPLSTADLYNSSSSALYDLLPTDGQHSSRPGPQAVDRSRCQCDAPATVLKADRINCLVRGVAGAFPCFICVITPFTSHLARAEAFRPRRDRIGTASAIRSPRSVLCLRAD